MKCGMAYLSQWISAGVRPCDSGQAFGYPRTIGATTWQSPRNPSSALTEGRFNHGRANPIQQVPTPSARAASIRFSAARQQSSIACVADDFAQNEDYSRGMIEEKISIFEHSPSRGFERSLDEIRKQPTLGRFAILFNAHRIEHDSESPGLQVHRAGRLDSGINEPLNR